MWMISKGRVPMALGRTRVALVDSEELTANHCSDVWSMLNTRYLQDSKQG
jgi:hypothetical protein